MSARLIQVIEVDELRGKGVTDDPARRVTVYYSTDGAFLSERDEWKDNGGDHASH